MQLRYYQKDCIEKLYQWLSTQTTNPLCVLATGSGKSVIIAQFIKTFIQQYPKTRFICCIDTKELVEQNFLKLIELWKTAPAGIYSSGLKRRDTQHQILFAGIQSIYNKADLIGERDILIIDECHMSNHNIGSMWDTFIKELSPKRIIGFTATPYRNDCGLIYTGDNAIYGGITYEYSVKQGIKDEYLSIIIPKKMTTTFDVSQVAKSNGDFNETQLQEIVNQKQINQEVVKEIIKYGQDRKGWLIFSAGCAHAEELHLILKDNGYQGGVILGSTPNEERDRLIKDFKAKKLRYLINNAVLTKGFDAPHIDLLAAVRPTISPVLWSQMVGRALRLCEGKENALLLDFAENIFRFGYIDDMVFSDKRKSKSEGKPVVKACPKCNTIMPAAKSVCENCGHEFPAPETDINSTSYNGAILSTQVEPMWVDVEQVHYCKHKSKKGDYLLKAEYMTPNYERYFEWICLEHLANTYPRKQAIKWWKKHVDYYLMQNEELASWFVKHCTHEHVPKTVDEALKFLECIKQPKKLKIIEDGNYWKVLERVDT